MKKSAIISECRMYRYQLERTWDDSLPKALIIMLNPSTADAERDDPTIRRCISFCKSWGFGGMFIGNLFAFRATNPIQLQISTLQGIDIIGSDNNEHLIKMFSECSEVVFAWGTKGTLINRNKDVINKFTANIDPKCISKSKDGHPGHPLYLRADLPLISF